MATQPQLIANRTNALASTGPVTDQGKSRISRNAAKTGLFSAGDFVLREETEIYSEFRTAYRTDLAPAGPIEETFTAEIIHAAWRLRRCSTIEESLHIKDGAYVIEETQKSVDRARAAAFRIFTRANTELRKIQTERRKAPVAVTAVAPAETPAPVNTKQTQSAPAQQALIPRGARCTCGSGVKYKRCCGKDAPAVLHLAA